MMLKPTSSHERLLSIDSLRGISLFGILLVNSLAFYTPQPYITDLENWFTSVKDIVLIQYLDIYVQSSFYPLFSMLFGLGVAMQYEKATQLNVKFYPFELKRLTILFAIGVLHAVLIWWGDILSTYAFCGLFLLIMIRLKPKWLFMCAVILNGLYQLFYLLILAVIGFKTPAEEIAVDFEQVQNSITAYGTGTWMDAFQQRLADLTIQFAPSMWFMSLFTILPYMLVGAALLKWRIFERATERKKMWISFAIVFIGVGLFLKNASILYTKTYFLEYVKVFVGGPILAFGYVALVVCICMLPKASKLLTPFAKMGRMSLSNYIMQSVILSFLFYRFGLGLYGKIDVQMGILICIGIIIFQMIFSELWFMKFKQGPIEYVMKKLTYGRKNII